MICEAMGTAETLVGAAVNSQLGQQVREYLPRFVAIDTSWFQGGQLAQSSFNQFQNNPNQFVQSQFSQNGPLVAAATAQLGDHNQGLLQSGQQVLQSGQQFLNSGQQFIQQLPQQQFQTNFGAQNQFQQTQFGPQQNQINRFYQNQLAQNQFSQNQFGQSQFGQNQFNQNQFSQNQFGQRPPGSSGSGGLVDSLVDGLAGVLASVPIGRRRRETSTMHGQAIR